MVNLCKTLPQVCMYLFVFLLFTVPTFASDQGWMVGKHLKLTYSANDALCGELLKYYDSNFMTAEEIRPGGHAIKNFNAVQRYNSHPFFLQNWEDASPYVVEKKDWPPLKISEADVNNDGRSDLILYQEFDHKEIEIASLLETVDGLSLQAFKAKLWRRSYPDGSYSKRDFKEQYSQEFVENVPYLKTFSLDGVGSYSDRKDLYEKVVDHLILRKHPNFPSEYNGRLADVPNFYFRWTAKSVLRFQGQTYLTYVAFIPDKRMGGVYHWGVVTKLNPNWTPEHICYFNINRTAGQ